MPPTEALRSAGRRTPEHTSSTTRPETPPSYLSAFQELDSPVLNLAETLTTPAEEEADEANISFLRTQINPQDEWRAQNAAAEGELGSRTRAPNSRAEDRERRERLQRVLSRLSHMQDPAYGDRTPTTNNLYDWSPETGGDDEEEMQHILQELRRQQPNTHPEILRVLGRSQLDAEREARNRAYSASSFHHLSSTQPSQSESSLRSAALLQSVRRHPRFSASRRDYMQRYITDRETAHRSVHDSNDNRMRFSPSRLANSSSAQQHNPETSRYELSRQAWQLQQRSAERNSYLDEPHEREQMSSTRQRDQVRARLETYRRSYLENPSTSPPSVNPWLEETIKYLSRLRLSSSYEDGLSYAVDAGFVTKEFFGDNHEDFVLDTTLIPPPPPSSWLAPGVVFSGSQHATSLNNTVTAAPSTATSTTLYRFRNNESMTSTTFDPARPWLSHSPSIPPHALRQSDLQRENPSTLQQDRWPVKVSIHQVNYDTMTLSATMEAYNVPSPTPSSATQIIHAANTSTSNHPTQSTSSTSYTTLFSAPPISTSTPSPSRSRNRTSSITTYLEGEILSFDRYTFLTESFPSTLCTDATYWRKLPPLNSFATDAELVHALVSKRFHESLSREYVLMRWKERCFVGSSATPPRGVGGGDRDVRMAEDGCGLTISGFYYVSLRRSDGTVEALYCDPQSSPYQHLRLKPVGGGGCWPVWNFR